MSMLKQGVVTTLDRSIKNYSFSYMPLGMRWQGWRTVKGRWDNVSDAAGAAGAWMMVCHDNDFPIAVKITEVK